MLRSSPKGYAILISISTPFESNSWDSTLNGSMDAFVSKLAPAGNMLLYSTFLGGSNSDEGFGAAVDEYGIVYVTGNTASPDFPVNMNDTELNGSSDAFVTMMLPQCCAGTRGNVDMVGIVDLADLSTLVAYLTGSSNTLLCRSEANINGMGIVDLGDLSALVSFLTGGGYVMPYCP